MTQEQKQEQKMKRKQNKQAVHHISSQIDNEPGVRARKIRFKVILLIIIVIAAVAGVWYSVRLDTNRRAGCEKLGGTFVSQRGNSALCVDKNDKIIKRYGYGAAKND